jgi:methylmalonyl-CoA mutase cobalamin-binding domain/chain
MSETNDLMDLWRQVFSRVPEAELGRSPPSRERAPRGRGQEEEWVRQTIETQIVPRLMLSHRRGPRVAAVRTRTIGADDVAELARIVVAHDAITAREFCEAIEAEGGVGEERILLDLFAPAAQLLGELWAADRCTFADVTVGLSVIQRMMRERGANLFETYEGPDRGRVVLAPVPGEQHTLGLQMLADFLRGDGWDVSHIPLATRDEIVRSVARERVEVLGLSVANSSLIHLSSRIAEDARAASSNPGLLVMVGGACVSDRETALEAGGDLHGAQADAVVTQLRERFRRDRGPSSPWPS